MRDPLCNVCIAWLQELIDFNPEVDEADIDRRLTGPVTADIPSEDYPAHWTRIEGAMLSLLEQRAIRLALIF